jgi:PAS domain S-box-containing protein
MWETIVLNLVSNAYKFTHRGGIAVTMGVSSGSAHLTVRDTGIGIPTDELPKLFERFHRVEGSQGRSHEGSGIGLALVRELVQLHSGSISVESTLGQGSAFQVAIPLGTAHLPADRIKNSGPSRSTDRAEAFIVEALSWSSDSGATNVEDHEESEGAHTFDGADLGASRPRVLLADDNADMRTHVGSLLYKAGYEVSAVADGEQALAACFAKPPDLVLTDAMMPKLDGFGLVTRLRSDERTALLPIILLSARAGEEARIDGLKTGADDYIVKPFGSRELLARVDAAVRLSRARREAMIREAEMARLRASFDDAAVGMAHVATDGRWLRVNDRLCAMIGYSRSELLGTTFQHITHPDDLATDLVWVNKLLAGEIATYAMEKRYLHKDGEIVWIILTVSLVRNADGTPDYFLSVIDDITARKRADIDLAESRSRLAGVVDSAMDAIITIDARQNVVLFNGAAERLFLRTAAEVVGQPLSLLLPQGFGDAHSQHINAFARTGVSNRTMGRPGPLAALRADGTEFPIEASISQTIVGGEKLFTSILRDITERKRAEDTQRLLLAELDHRVKNTLANVQAIAMQTLSATADPVTFVESFNGRIRALGRAHTLLTRSSWEGADLATLIKDQLTVDAGDAGNRISCIGPQVQLEPQTALHLGLVLHELGTNARKHGSLSRPRGSLATVWSVTADGGLPELRLRWVESDGPLVVAPAKRGFGSILIERSLQHALGGDARLDYAPSGVICEIRLPLAQREKGAYGGKLTEDSA